MIMAQSRSLSYHCRKAYPIAVAKPILSLSQYSTKSESHDVMAKDVAGGKSQWKLQRNGGYSVVGRMADCRAGGFGMAYGAGER